MLRTPVDRKHGPDAENERLDKRWPMARGTFFFGFLVSPTRNAYEVRPEDNAVVRVLRKSKIVAR